MCVGGGRGVNSNLILTPYFENRVWTTRLTNQNGVLKVRTITLKQLTNLPTISLRIEKDNQLNAKMLPTST